MQDFLIQKLTALSDDEREALDRIAFGMMEAETGNFEIKDTRLTRGNREVIVLPHTRYTAAPPHKHNYVEIVIVLGGSVTHIIDGREVVLEVGDILFLNSHISHAIKKTERGDVAVNIIMARSFISALYAELCDTVFSDFIKETTKDDGAGIYLHFKTGGKRQIENLTENILYELTEYQSSNVILTRTVALLFHYLSLKNKELLVERRIERAKELLCETDMPIGQIIRSMGYENESYFHREFKRRTGLSPLAIRRDARSAEK